MKPSPACTEHILVTCLSLSAIVGEYLYLRFRMLGEKETWNCRETFKSPAASTIAFFRRVDSFLEVDVDSNLQTKMGLYWSTSYTNPKVKLKALICRREPGIQFINIP